LPCLCFFSIFFLSTFPFFLFYIFIFKPFCFLSFILSTHCLFSPFSPSFISYISYSPSLQSTAAVDNQVYKSKKKHSPLTVLTTVQCFSQSHTARTVLPCNTCKL
jgi:hypothetical protein